MTRLQFKKIDAFATKESEGNPSGYILLNSLSDLTDSQMQKIARDLKGFVNEIGFVAQTSDKCFSLKFFSSECEVAFCGHATVAIMYDLIKNDLKLKRLEKIYFKTRRGELSVKNEILNEDAVFIMSPAPLYKELKLNIEEISNALNILPSAILYEKPVSVINAGLTTLIIPINTIDEILSISPDFKDLQKFCLDSDIDIVEVFTSDVIDRQNDYRVRVFAPKYGYLEDPATGTGNSAFGYYLIENNLFEKEIISIEQNGDRNRFNVIKLRKETNTAKRDRILFGGNAITRIEGSYIL